MTRNFSGEINVSVKRVGRAAGSAMSVPGETPTGGRRPLKALRLLSPAFTMTLPPSRPTGF